MLVLGSDQNKASSDIVHRLPVNNQLQQIVSKSAIIILKVKAQITPDSLIIM